MSEKDSIEARAKAFINTPGRGRITFNKLAAFAQQELDRQASDAVEKERERIATDLEDLLSMEFVDNSPSAFRSRVRTFIDQLRGQSK